MDRVPSKLPFSKRRLRPRVVISYIADYVILVACIAGFYILDSIEPHHQHFSLQNISLQYPYAVHERISIALALVVSGVSPLVIIAVYTLFIDGLFSHNKPVHPVSGKRRLTGPYRWKDRLWEFNCGFLGLLLSQGLAFVITQALKTACGKPRPDIIDRCQPRPGSHDALPYGLSNSSICTGDPAIIKDGFRSWPSGHSSSSFAGLFFLTLWMSGKLHLMDNKGEVWKTILVMIPSLAATLIAVSRIMDARHHPFDVISGSLLGIICAYVAYRQYFPSLSEPWKKGRAYPIRSWGTEASYPGGANISPSESTTALRGPGAEQQMGTVHNGPELTGSPNHQGIPPSYQPTPNNPYMTNRYQRQRSPSEGNWSSSEDDVTDGYEMQHGYAQSHTPTLSDQTGPGLPRYQVDTAYLPQTQSTSGMENPHDITATSDSRPLTHLPPQQA